MALQKWRSKAFCVRWAFWVLTILISYIYCFLYFSVHINNKCKINGIHTGRWFYWGSVEHIECRWKLLMNVSCKQSRYLYSALNISWSSDITWIPLHKYLKIIFHMLRQWIFKTFLLPYQSTHFLNLKEKDIFLIRRLKDLSLSMIHFVKYKRKAYIIIPVFKKVIF